jgi:hypothetical protein
MATLVVGIGLAWASYARADGPPTKRCIAAAEEGQQQRRSGKLNAARASFVACTAMDCPAVVRRDCARWVDELDATIPTIVVRLEDEAGRDATEGRVLLDGETLAGAASGRSFPVDPGTHRIAWLRSGGDLDEEIVVREGERNRVVVLRPKTSRTTDKPADAAVPSQTASRRSTVLPFFVGGAGLALAGAGGVLWAVGLSQRSTLEGTCAPTHTCSDADVHASQAKLVVGDVLVGIGVVAVAAAVYLLLRPDDAPPAAAAR